MSQNKNHIFLLKKKKQLLHLGPRKSKEKKLNRKRKKKKREEATLPRKKTKKERQRYLLPREKKKNNNKGMCTWTFLSIKKKFISTQFFLHFWKKTFW